MALERRETNINGRVYVLLTPTPRQAMPICTNLATLLGPVIGSLGVNVKEGGMARLLQALQDVDPDRLDSLMMRAVKASQLSCNKVAVHDDLSFDKHFGEYPGDAFQACGWVLWEVTKDFFPQSGNFIQKLKEKAAEALEKEFPSQKDGN